MLDTDYPPIAAEVGIALSGSSGVVAALGDRASRKWTELELLAVSGFAGELSQAVFFASILLLSNAAIHSMYLFLPRVAS